jgi:hypothetical protein
MIETVRPGHSSLVLQRARTELGQLAGKFLCSRFSSLPHRPADPLIVVELLSPDRADGGAALTGSKFLSEFFRRLLFII